MSSIKCPKCRKKLNEAMIYCANCGSYVEDYYLSNEKKQGGDSKKNNILNKVIIICLVLFIVALLAGIAIFIYQNKKITVDNSMEKISTEEVDEVVSQGNDNGEIVEEQENPEYEYVKISVHTDYASKNDGSYTESYYDFEGKSLSLVSYYDDKLVESKSIFDNIGYKIFYLSPNFVSKCENDLNGNCIKTVAYNSDWTINSFWEDDYDENNRKIETRHGDGSVTKYVYDDSGKIIEESDEDGDVTRYVYDDSNNLIKETFYDGLELINEVTYEYDQNNNCVYKVDKLGEEKTNEYIYDSDNNILYNLTSYNGKKSIETYYTYDNGLKVLAVENAYNDDGSKNLLLTVKYEYGKSKKHEHNLEYSAYGYNMHKGYCADSDCDYFVILGCKFDADTCELCGAEKEDIYFNGVNIYEIDESVSSMSSNQRIDIKDYHDSVPSVWFGGTLDYELATGINDSKPIIISDDWDDISYIYDKAIEIYASANGDGYFLKWTKECDMFSIYGLYVGMTKDDVKELAQKDGAIFDGEKYSTSESSSNNEQINITFSNDKVDSILFSKQVSTY